MKIIIPLAGKDPRFENLNIYKSLIMINGKPLIYHVLNANDFPFENLHFIILHEHEKKHAVSKHLKNTFGNQTSIHIIDKETEGSPNTILQIEDVLNDDEDMFVELGDVVRNLSHFKKDIESYKSYAGIIPIDSEFTTKMWGYVKIKDGSVLRLYEKSLEKMKGGATMGLYYFSKGSEFVRYAKQMISKNIKIPPLNLYYVGPVYNEYIDDEKEIGVSWATILDILGSPDEINAYLEKLTYNR